MPGCCVCKSTTQQLRPYGPEGADICFDCAMSDPERKVEAERRMRAFLDVAAERSGGMGIVLSNGNEPPVSIAHVPAGMSVGAVVAPLGPATVAGGPVGEA